MTDSVNRTQHPKVGEVYLRWRADLQRNGDRGRRFDAWLFLNASSVLLSEKTGELLAADLKELGLSQKTFRRELSRLAEEWQFRYKVFFESSGRIKFIIYQADRLAAALEEAPTCVLHAKLGYPRNISPTDFLEQIGDRWQSKSEIPHEIGLALGYPAYDVFGFMGLLPLACKGVCGWRVYGCLAESKRRSCAFLNARCRALAFLANPSSADACELASQAVLPNSN